MYFILLFCIISASELRHMHEYSCVAVLLGMWYKQMSEVQIYLFGGRCTLVFKTLAVLQYGSEIGLFWCTTKG